jgi:alpha-amylase/alpha-mannosidase (GH57 family)
MHQPYYEDLSTGEHILPWVRMHALKDYYGMAAMLEEFPRTRVTFNLVPSLLVQLEAFAADRARDRYLELGLKPAADLSAEETSFVLKNFFHAHRAKMIDPHARYAELFSMRGASTAPGDLVAAARRYTAADLRDLQVWQKLAWLDPLYTERDPRVRSLLFKGGQFSEDDKVVLRTIELEILNAVIPAYRNRREAGQIEISTSPFYHPILPLLCDTDVYRPAGTNLPAPRRRFSRPDDAVAQLERAVACHERLFGRRPTGLWPSEGSVSEAVVRLAGETGFRWMATDEMILARSLGVEFSRDGAGHSNQPERLYVPYTVTSGGREVVCGFRDHTLSDLIGFTYAGWSANRAADDLLSRLVEAGRRFTTKTGGEEATIFVVLDGENAWEHFDGGGRPFLRALYAGLSSHPDLRTVTMSEACEKGARRLPALYAGSWIDASFYIWIGHADDQRAWGQLADAREALDKASGGPPPEAVTSDIDGRDAGPIEPDAGAVRDVERVGDAAAPSVEHAYEEILIAEGSDWFWWYGDDHSSEHDAEFDDLFRRHVRNAYGFLRQPVPDELFVSNISTGAPTHVQTDPTRLLAPTLDGEDSSYFEWLGAGTLQVRDVAGAMHRADGRQSILTIVRFGIDRERLFVRIDSTRAARDLLADGYQYTLTFLEPEGRRLTISGPRGTAETGWWVRARQTGPWISQGVSGSLAAAGSVLELALPLVALGHPARAAIAFLVGLIGPTGTELERHPPQRPLTLLISGEQFAARNWTA